MHPARLLVAAAFVASVSIGIVQAVGDNNYIVTTLVSNQTGVAPTVDPLLVNGWGIAASPTGPWWVSDNGTNFATIYSGAGVKAALEVTVPGAPTGTVFYGGTQFQLAPGLPARFIFAAEDGTFSAWNPGFDLTNAHVVFSDPGSVYKGLAVLGDTLYTTDFTECGVETFDGTFTEFDSDGEFEDDSIPAGYCPFGIQAIGSSIFVTYALTDGPEDVAGQGHGFVREFDAFGHLIATVASRGQLNSPWGLAMAPSDFGPFSNCLLVGILVTATSRRTAGTEADTTTMAHSGRAADRYVSMDYGASDLATAPGPEQPTSCISRPGRMRRQTVHSGRSSSRRPNPKTT